MKKLLIASAILVFAGGSAMAQSTAAKKQMPSKVMQQQAENKAKAAPQADAPKAAANESARDAKKRAEFNAKAAELVDPRAVRQN